jgi:transposase-like protein
VDLKQRGLVARPKLTVGGGAIGFWAALHKAYPGPREQRCWMHKSGNVLDKRPKNVQSRAKDDIHQVSMGETPRDAEHAFALFLAY